MYKLIAAVLLFAFAVPAQNYKIVRDGIEHAEVVAGSAAEPLRINLLRLDLTKVRLQAAHALDAAIGVEKTSSIARRNGALAAINAGFFRLDSSLFAGDNAGTFVVDNRLLSDSVNDRTSLFIFNGPARTDVRIARIGTNGYVVTDLRSSGVRGAPNRERTADDLVIYTPDFGRSTLTGPDGVEVIVRRDKVSEIRNSAGSSRIPEDGFVVSASGNRIAELLRIARKGKKLVLITEGFSSEFKGPYEDIVGGVPRLIRGGKVEVTWKEEKAAQSFAEMRHPRSAVAIMNDGKLLMVAVDGRQEGYSVGMTLKELVEFLLGIGAVDAMNLDGGGSTSMYLDGKIINRPSDKEGERRVSDAILVFPRN